MPILSVIRLPSSPPQLSLTASAARLMLSKLVLENFKSYAGTREIGPFHKSFSSIVGPNGPPLTAHPLLLPHPSLPISLTALPLPCAGSGKSNVIDALLFVFGYRATQIRLKKLSRN